MPEFYYTARSQDGSIIKDKLSAPDERALEQTLKEGGLTLMSIKKEEIAKKVSIGSFFEKFQRIPSIQKMFFTQHLQVMVRTGFSIGKALSALAEQTTHKLFKKIILEIKKDVESGVSLSKSLTKHPKAFSEMYVSMVAAGETSGKLDEVLYRLAIQMRKDHALISKVKNALTYPILVVVAMIGIGMAMMAFVLPKLMAFFQEAKVSLPLPTRILVGTSNFFSKNFYFVIIGIILAIFLFIRLKKVKKVQFIIDKMILKLPIMASIVKKINLSKFTRSLSSLLKTDISIIEAFQIISRTLGNVHYKNAMLEAAEQVKTGSSIVSALEKRKDLFPPIVVQMVSVGEESGTLDNISEEIANFYEEDVDQTMNNLTSIIEPVLIIVLGAAVAGIAIAIILPIYSLSQTI